MCRDDEIDIIDRGEPQAGHCCLYFDWPALFEQILSAEQATRLSTVRIVIPESLDLVLFAEQHMRVLAILGEVSERLDSGIRSSFDQYITADQGHALELALFITARVELALIVRADDSVASNESCHSKSVYWPLAQERHHFAFVVGRESLHCHRLTWSRPKSDRIHFVLI